MHSYQMIPVIPYFRGPKRIGQINIILNNVIIFSTCVAFVECLNSATHRHHALPALYCHLQFLFVSVLPSELSLASEIHVQLDPGWLIDLVSR